MNRWYVLLPVGLLMGVALVFTVGPGPRANSGREIALRDAYLLIYHLAEDFRYPPESGEELDRWRVRTLAHLDAIRPGQTLDIGGVPEKSGPLAVLEVLDPAYRDDWARLQYRLLALRGSVEQFAEHPDPEWRERFVKVGDALTDVRGAFTVDYKSERLVIERVDPAALGRGVQSLFFLLNCSPADWQTCEE